MTVELHSPDPERWAKLVDVPLPRWVKVRQRFPAPEEADLAAAVRRELARPEIARHLRPGLSVALGVGSRGLAGLAELVAAAVAALRDAGCQPFVTPAMGSHGGATAEGQREVLARYGISEQRVGAPVRAAMEVVELGRLAGGEPVYFDRLALEADLVVPLNRIKSHTSFRGPVESGLTKLLVIGFGNHAGATALHAPGWSGFAERLLAARELISARVPFRFGLATIENAYGAVAQVEAVLAERLAEREPELLKQAKSLAARLQFEQLDLLVVGASGKNIAGTGMDPAITGRAASGLPGALDVTRLVVLDLTPETHGNATGLGMADITTTRVVCALDLDATWVNALTSTSLSNARIPIFMPNDRLAIALALKTCNRADLDRARVVWLRNTLALGEIYLSEALWEQVVDHPGFAQAGEPAPLPFDETGNLLWPNE